MQTQLDDYCGDLMYFAPTGPMPLKILCVESSLYLPRLRQNLPSAELFAMTRYEEVCASPPYDSLAVEWTIGDYRREPLPGGEGQYDLILAETCFECVWEPYETLMRLSRALKDTGVLLGSFLNVRCYRVLEELRRGRFPYREQRLYAKDEAVKMLNDAIFKEIIFAPFGHLPTSEDKAKAAAWRECGFDDFNDELATAAYMFRAARSKAEVAALKEMYDAETRRLLARLLRRLEYDIDGEQNFCALRKLCQEKMIFAEYLTDFIAQTTTHKDRLRDLPERIFGA